jgi:hypothetical protein
VSYPPSYQPLGRLSNVRTFLKIVAGLSVALAINNLGFAAKNYLPDRDKPVPANEPVPTVDFVRPPLFGRPGLSPDGKYFAALTKGEDLRSNLVVCEITTGQVLMTHVDVPFFSWISNEHLSLDWSENRVVKVSDPGHLLHVETVVPKYKFGLMADTGYLRTSDRRTEPQLGRSEVGHKWYSPQDGELSYCEVWREDGQRELRGFDG